MRAKILRSCCTIAMSLSSVWPVFAQDEILSIAPTEPSNNAALVSNVQSSMDYFSGAAYVQIPLYTLSEFGMQVPISIGYKTSGIKVEDVASPVGLGWNLSAGGKVVRMLKRNPDESEYGYFNEQSWWRTDKIYDAIEAKNTDDDPKRDNPITAKELLDIDNKIDMEPDLFYFEIPGYSGMFVCDRDAQVHTIPYQNLKITWVDRSYFTIKDPGGNTYTLGQTAASQERSEYDSDVNGDGKVVDCTSSWLLDRIEDQFGNRITFTYREGAPIVTDNQRSTYTFTIDHWYDPSVHNPVIYNPTARDFKINPKTVRHTLQTPKYLQSIQGRNTEIRFAVGARTDHPNTMKYNQIDLLVQGKKTKSIGFKYSYFTSTTPRLRLDGVYEQIGGTSIGVIVPFAGSTSNSDYGQSLLSGKTEKIADFTYNTMPELPVLPPTEPPYIPPYNPDPTDPPIVSNGVDSSSTGLDLPVPEAPKYEMPDRNTSDFDHWGYYRGYASFDTRNTDAFPKFNDGFCSFSGEVLPNTTAARRDPVLDFAKSGSLARVYHRTGGYTEYRYELNQIVKEDVTVDMGGLRVKQIAQVADGKEQVTTLTYGPGVRAGYRPNYSYYVSRSWYVAPNGRGTTTDLCPPGWTATGKTQYSVSSRNNGENYNYRGSEVEYPWVRETFPNGAYNVYNYLTGNDEEHEDISVHKYTGDIDCRMVLRILDFSPTPIVTSRFWRRGLLSKTRHYDAAGNLISSVTNNYSFGVPRAVIHAYSPALNGSGVIEYRYKWYSEPVFLTSTVTDAGLYNTASTVLYTYDTDYLVPTEVKKTDVSGVETTTKITYPFTYLNNSMSNYLIELFANKPLPLLLRRGMHVPIETTTVRNGKIVGGEFISYRSIEVPGDDGTSKIAVVPASKSSLTLTEALYPSDFTASKYETGGEVSKDRRYVPRIFYDHYDLDGRLLTSHASDGNPQSVLYDSAGRPIAKIENAVVAPRQSGVAMHRNEVYYTSFEDNTDTSYGAAAKTGAKTWLGSYTVPFANLVPGARYSLSYWRSYDWGETWEQVNKTFVVRMSQTTNTNIIDEGSQTCIDELRIMPVDARMTTYTYDPNGTVTSVTDTNGVTTYYQYDEFGRLIRTLDNHHQTMKSYEYHLKNQ